MFFNRGVLLGFLSSLLSIASSAGLTNRAPATVKTKFGTLNGRADPVSGINGYYDIPYAQPPIGNLRLQGPKPWTMPFEKSNFGDPSNNRCYGIGLMTNSLVTGSEDCLYLDVIQPTVIPNKLMSVYVFIHGGDFNDGSKSDNDGRNLVISSIRNGNPIIYVSINYRLAFLGYPGGSEAGKHNAYNLGLIDQLMALMWVKANIQSFGGDPNSITLGGQGTGADSVAYQMMAGGGVNHGLFQRVFLESGAATGLTPIPKADYAPRQQQYNSIVQKSGCTNAPDTFVCLQGVPIDTLSQAFFTTYNESHSIPHHVYAPIVEGNWFQDYPSILMKQGRFIAVPTLIGHTTSELSLRIPTFANFIDDKSELGFTGAFLSYTPLATLQALLNLFSPSDYADIGPPGSGSQWSRVVDVDNYLQSFCPVFTAANQISNKGAPVWKYRWDALHSGSTVPAFYGVSQGADLPFLYSPQPLQGTRVDVNLGYAFQSYVLSFINHGDPNLDKIPGGPPAWQWSEYSTNNNYEMVFSEAPQNTNQPMIFMEADPTDHAKCDFVEAHNVDFLR